MRKKKELEAQLAEHLKNKPAQKETYKVEPKAS